MFNSAAGFSGVPGGGSIPGLNARVTALEDAIIKAEYFELINSSSGSITPPSGATIALDQFASSVDALVSTIDASNRPTFQTPQTAGGTYIAVSSFDASGNYVLTGTPSSFPVAIVYVYTIERKNFNSTLSLGYEETNLFTDSDKQTLYSSIIGPSSSTDNAIIRFNGTTGKLAQNSLITIDDSGNLDVPNGCFIRNPSGVQVNIANKSLAFETANSSTIDIPFYFLAGIQQQSSGNIIINTQLTLYNQSGTASSADLVIERLEAALGSGQHDFIILKAGASSTVEKFRINNSGAIKTGIWNGSVVEYQYGGTGLSSLGSSLQLLRVNSAGTALEYVNPTNQTITLSNEATGSGSTSISVTLSNSAVIGKVLTGYTSGAGTVSSTDTILQAIQKLNGNTSAITSSQWVTTGSDIYYSTGNVMIGNASAPTTVKLQTVETSTSALRGVSFDQYSNSSNGSRRHLRKARGTFVTPLTIVTADVIGNDLYWAYDGTSFVNCGSINVTSTGTITTGQTPTTMGFMTMTAGGVLTTALTLDQTQKGTFPNTVELTTLSILDTTYKTAIDVSAANTLRIGNGFTTISIPNPSTFAADITLSGARTIQSSSGITIKTTTSGGNTITLQTVGGDTTGQGVLFQNNANITTSTGTKAVATFSNTFAPTTGSGVFNGLDLKFIINQTNGGVAPTGVMSLININPTVSSVITSLYGLRSQISASPTGGGTAWNIYADGTAANYFGGDITIQDKNLIFGTSTGTKIGTATTQKLSFYNSTPIVQPANTVAIDTLLVNIGLRATGGVANFATSVNLPAGTATAGTAPLKFTSGTNLTTAEAGTFEYNGTNFFATRTGTTRENILTGTKVTGTFVTPDTANAIQINVNGTSYNLQIVN